MRGATRLILLRRQPRRFQSTLLMRGATGLANDGFCHHSISIHAPHARSDDGNTSNHQVYKGISIHAPHARSDRLYWSSMTSAVNFNPRSSCEERLHKNGTAARGRHFNPRSSCEERLLPSSSLSSMSIDFNPRSSCEERRSRPRRRPRILYFNPRSSCEERLSCGQRCHRHQNFNPRSSCEERRFGRELVQANPVDFNPRSSCEERQGFVVMGDRDVYISIHAPHARSDILIFARSARWRNFNPRSSCEERLAPIHRFLNEIRISIHAPHARSDWLSERPADVTPEFQSTLLMRGATQARRGKAR